MVAPQRLVTLKEEVRMFLKEQNKESRKRGQGSHITSVCYLFGFNVKLKSKNTIYFVIFLFLSFLKD